jgi:hypothetical protein
MKKGKIIFLIIIALLSACKKEDDSKKTRARYVFTNADQVKLLPHYIKGNILTFVNDGGEERQIEVVEIEQLTLMANESGGSVWRYYFYYEMKRIYIKDLRDGRNYSLIIKRFPKDIEGAKLKMFETFPSHLVLDIADDSHWYPYYYPISFFYGNSTTAISINGITYKWVHISDRNYLGETTSGGTIHDAKYTYFDENYGFIGFDSYDGDKWRIVNP